MFTWFTRMPCGRNSAAVFFVKHARAALEQEYANMNGAPPCAAQEPMLTEKHGSSASSPRLDVTRKRLGEQEWSFYVRMHHRVPQFWSRRLQIAAREAGRRRVHEEVDRAKSGDGRVHNFCRSVLVPEIDGYECRPIRSPFSVDLFANLLATRGIPARDENASRARLCAVDRNAPAEPTRPSGDDDHFALESGVPGCLESGGGVVLESGCIAAIAAHGSFRSNVVDAK